MLILGLIISILVTGMIGLYAKSKKKMFFGLAPLIISVLFSMIGSVPANAVGVQYNPLKGGTQGTTLSEGFVVKNPFTKVYKISTKVSEISFNEISLQTKDSQYVVASIVIQARVDSTQAFEYFKKYGSQGINDISSILSNTVQKELESITTQYNVIDILGEARSEIVTAALEGIKEELIKDGIMIERLTLVDTDAGESIEKAISAEAVAKKALETAQYEKEKVEVKEEAKVIEAQKEKEANDYLSETLTEQILTKLFLEKWDGKLPTVTGGDSNILDITSLIGE